MPSKPLYELCLSDFEDHDAWTWADEDDESLVCPIDEYCRAFGDRLPDCLPWKSEVFARGVVQTADGDRCIAEIAVREGEVYVLNFARTDHAGTEVSVPFQDSLRRTRHIESLERFLGKKEEGIFPLTVIVDIESLGMHFDQVFEYPYVEGKYRIVRRQTSNTQAGDIHE